MIDTTQEMIWFRDGHRIRLSINRNEVVVSEVICPQPKTANCQLGKLECIVKYFLDTYGLECNVGSCACAEEIEISWCVVGDVDDAEQCQVWIIPVEDDAFSAWLIAQSS